MPKHKQRSIDEFIPDKVRAITLMGNVMEQYCVNNPTCRSMELEEGDDGLYHAVEHNEVIDGLLVITTHCVKVCYGDKK